MLQNISCYRGCLVGLAVGDAVGTTLEFSDPESEDFAPISDMIGGGPFRLEPGQWTDDTSMALCLAESLIESKGFDAKDQMNRYVQWYKEGYWSSTGKCFDIGTTTSASLHKYIKNGEPFAGSVETESAGNGSIMRLAPIAMFFAQTNKLERMAIDSSRTTHGNTLCVDACRVLALQVAGLLNGIPKNTVLSPEYFAGMSFMPEIQEIVDGSYKEKEPPDIAGKGYVVKSLEAALWAFYKTTNFKDGCLKAVNLGHDADTTAAVYGQLAGAYYTINGIPREWLNKLYNKDIIVEFADQLFNAACIQGDK